jgi:hypothetical protein
MEYCLSVGGGKPNITRDQHRFNLNRTDRERESWWVVGDTTFNGGDRAMFTAMKVPRQYPLVLLVKVGWRGGKTFGC